MKLQSQPFKVLAALVENPGEVVTREELQLKLWGKNIVVDFDHSLGTAIKKIREALGDSAENPRFVETLAKRGYRFIAPVQEIASVGPEVLAPSPIRPIEARNGAGRISGLRRSSPARVEIEVGEPQTTEMVAGDIGSGSSIRWQTTTFTVFTLWLGVAVMLALGVGAGFWAGRLHGWGVGPPPHITQITHDGHLAPTISTMEELNASATDGVHLYAATINNGRPLISSIALHFGTEDPMDLSDEIAGPAVGDISPDGSQLLLRSHLSPESEQPLWVVPTLGGSGQRVGEVLAHDATWMPDGEGILYAAGNQLYLTKLGASRPEPYATLPGRAFWMRWQPGGKKLRFTILDPIAHTTTLWQLASADRKPERILTQSGGPSTGCCGVWVADGSGYVFQSTGDGGMDLWELMGSSTDNPTRLTNGPLEFQAPVAARSGRKIYFLGVDERSELEHISATGTMVPEKGFLAQAVRVDFSRDGRWVAWTDGQGQLWRARSDGTDELQLTTDPLDVFLPRWSPDGSRLAIMARESGKAWQIYTIDAKGGEPRPLLTENRNAADPSWSPDGQSIVFGRINDYMGKENGRRNLEILRLSDSSVSEIPDSTGLFSPRWSPDGRFIAALTLDQRAVKVYDMASRTWKMLPVSSGADPMWSADSRSLFVHESMNPKQPIDRIMIPEMQVEEVAVLATSKNNDAVDFVFVGLGADGRPLVRSRFSTGNIYSLDLR